MYRDNEKGQTIIEVILAVVISSIVLVGMTKMILASFSNVNFSENQVNASTYAQQGMDYLRSMHDTNYTKFMGYVGRTTFCLNQDNSLNTGGCLNAVPTPNVGPNATPMYIRTAKFQSRASCSGTNSIQVTVAVAWNDNKCPGGTFCHQSQLVSCYTDATVAPTL